MTWHAAGLRRLDGIIWALITAVTGLVLASPLLSHFQLVWHSFLAAGCTTTICLAGTWFYQARRPDSNLAAALGGTAQIVAFAAVGAPLSYLAASLDLPLQDRWFDQADRAMGLDWTALLAWMDAHAAFHPLFRTFYWSLMPQTVVVVLTLALAGRLAWLRIFVLAFVIATLVSIVAAAIVPAEGVWGFYQLHGTDYPDIAPATQQLHLAVFHGLRDGTFRQLMANGAEGIITFPSLHAALALLLAAGLWPIAYLRWAGLALNAVMLLSIPVDGGHYFVDVAAGLTIAWASLAVTKAIAKRAHQPLGPRIAAEIGLVPGE